MLASQRPALASLLPGCLENMSVFTLGERTIEKPILDLMSGRMKAVRRMQLHFSRWELAIFLPWSPPAPGLEGRGAVW